jgi:NADPH-dependent glutamate synthase beta subunit-like oxidoreductase
MSQERIARPVSLETLAEIPDITISTSDTLVFKTGSWRYVQPIYVDKTSPCNEACPAGVNIQSQMRLVADGQFRKAAELFRQEHPFPAVTGRCCFHPCEIGCNRKDFDQPVNINGIERRIGDEALKFQTNNPNKGIKKEKIAIVGSGPSGLTCAFYLAMMGYSITVFEKEEKPGGVLRYGIPAYRLPKDVLDVEIANIEQVGVEIKTGVEIGTEVTLEQLKTDFDLVYLATGVWRSKSMRVKNEDAEGVMSGLEFLKSVAKGEEISIGPKVAIIGGGNTAMDACRTAKRIGLDPVVVYRRTKAEMPANEEEIQDAIDEGIPFQFLTAPSEVVLEEGKVTGLRCQKMQLGRPDESGRRRPEPVEGSEFIMPVDTVLSAIGEEPAIDWVEGKLKLEWKKIVVDALGATEDGKIFAGGDVIDQNHTVVDAIGAGKKAAMAMDARFKGADIEEMREKIRVGTKGSVSTGKYFGTHPEETHDVVRYKDLNPDYFEVAPRNVRPMLPVEERINNFDEVKTAMSDEEVIAEAKRCFNCGSCIECDNCILYCPDIAVLREPEGGVGVGAAPYKIDYEYCKGCLVCVHECPRSAMSYEEVVR